MTSNPAPDAHSATAVSGDSGNGAVRKPSFIEDVPQVASSDRCGHRGRAIDLYPASGPGALRDRVTDEHLVVAVGERGVGGPLRGPAGCDVCIDRPEERREGVGETLDVTRG